MSHPLVCYVSTWGWRWACLLLAVGGGDLDGGLNAGVDGGDLDGGMNAGGDGGGW